MRTNIIIDHSLMERALSLSGLQTKCETVEAGPRLLAPALARWLMAFGVAPDSAKVIAARLPRRFGLAL